MQKARIFKYSLGVFVAFMNCSSALAQPVLGQIIEQTKKNKLNELLQPKSDLPSAVNGLPGALPVKKNPTAAPKSDAEPPVLWSLSGVNSRLVAEVWESQGVQRIVVAPGRTLSSGWTVLAVDADSLTLKRGKKTQTLYPAALGTTGAEYTQLKKPQRFEDAILADLVSGDRSMNSPRSVSSFPNPVTSLGDPQPAVKPNSPMDAIQAGISASNGSNASAREAASSLPKATK